jgi:hypothetical protein
MFYKLRTRLNKRYFDWRARGIFDTPPVRCRQGSSLVVLTQLHHPDLTMYMAAAKSFCRFVQPGRFVIVDDGLTASDRATLQRHFENLSFVPSRQLASPECPTGGCWERLLGIAELNAQHYVVQLDADTITLSRPDEVISCIERNTSFTLGTTGGQAVISTAEASRIASGWPGEHVQVLAEQALAQLPPELGTRYVHGCAGFAGFHAGCIDRARVESVSAAMARVVAPTKWAEWGSEQVVSNYLVANSAGATILPPRTYPFWKPGVDVDIVRLVHFFGTHRFEGGRYNAIAAALAADLRTT